MKAINLIPTDYRRGALAGRGGVVASYALLGGLAALLIAVVMVVLAGNQISDRQAEVGKLKQEKEQAEARASALQSFATFRSMAEQRVATVSSLAQSRFDWERVMRELSVVIPPEVWLTKVAGSVTPDVALDDSPNLSSRQSVAGPALEVVGCAPDQDVVAKFIASLEDIDGVTRVGVQSSDKPEQATQAAVSSGPGGNTSDECRTRDFITKFELVVAFDAAPVPPSASGTLPAPTAPTTPPASGDSGTADAQAQSTQYQNSVQEQTDKAHRVTHDLAGGQ